MTSPKPLPRIDAQGVIDMHVHTGPEFLQRRYDPFSLSDEARREGIGIVMKNHFQPTTTWALLARREGDEVPIIGSVVLNHMCGGIDDHGIRGALSGWKSDAGALDPDTQRFVVWMPTFCAGAHLDVMGGRDIPLHWGVNPRYSREFADNEGIVLLDKAGKVPAGLDRALSMIAEWDLILASGHLSADETKSMVWIAKQRGINRIVLTHPLWDASQLTAGELATLWREYGAYTELCFVNLAICGMDTLCIEQYVEVIDAVGPEGVILSSDLGQPSTLPMADGLRMYFHLLEEAGVHPDDIARMSIVNPRNLLF